MDRDVARAAHVLWFTILALAAIMVLTVVGRWYRRHLGELQRARSSDSITIPAQLPSRTVTWALVVLGVLLCSKFFYLAHLPNFYVFFLIEKFTISAERAQPCLFVLLFAFAVGTILGDPVGDRWGRGIVIGISIPGPALFALLLPHVSLAWCVRAWGSGRCNSRVGFFRHPRLCAGVDAGTGGPGVGFVFRRCVRPRGRGLGRARPARRSYEHRIGFRSLRVSPAARAGTVFLPNLDRSR